MNDQECLNNASGDDYSYFGHRIFPYLIAIVSFPFSFCIQKRQSDGFDPLLCCSVYNCQLSYQPMPSPGCLPYLVTGKDISEALLKRR